MFAAAIALLANEAAALLHEQEAVVAAARLKERSESVNLPPLESGRWKFTRHKGRLVGTIQVETKSVGLYNSFAAVYGPTYLTSKTPYLLPVTFSSEGREEIASDVGPLLEWCRTRIKTAELRELDTRLWVALYTGPTEQGEEAVRLMTATYTRHKFGLGFINLIKHCVRSGPGDSLPVLRAAERILRRIPRSEADSLAAAMRREWPDWQGELKSDWPDKD